jgi:hypothetical protein
MVQQGAEPRDMAVIAHGLVIGQVFSEELARHRVCSLNHRYCHA